ncbi:GtrA family protein [Aeromicrobium sp.]|nr:GtrA family protein [Candidatus Saccharibacteria bacterium]
MPKLSSSFLRFCLVGAVNTTIDASLFVVLRSNGFSVVVANIISTSVALLIGLLLSYKYTFRGRLLTKSRVAIYFAVTLAGVWILQPIIISGVLALNDQAHFTAPAVALLQHTEQLDSLFAKLVATVFSLAWNYAWYSRVVFKDQSV